MRSLIHSLTQLNKQVSSFMLMLGFVLVSLSAIGQEKPENHEEVQIDHSQTLDGPFILREKETPRDSAIVVPVKAAPAKPKQEAAKKEEEEDPLSFNFLYFIFQKFKGSDIVND